MVNILCTTLLVIASLHVGLVYPLKSSSHLELETHEAIDEADASKLLTDLEKELNAIIEDTDVDKDNKEEVLDADRSFMQDKYDNNEDGMTQDDEDEDGMSQDDEDVSLSRDDSKPLQRDGKKLTIQGCRRYARYYYRLYRRYYYLACRQRKFYYYYYRLYRRYYILYRRAYSRYICYLRYYRRYYNLYRRYRG